MYGDDTVRPQKKITNLQSGLAVAGKEFGFGIYDGVAGLFTQPVKGAIKEGPIGFAKGLGKGLGGFVLKPGAAMWGVPGYAFKGMWREIEALSRSNTKEALRSARIAQGMEETESITAGEADQICQKFRDAIDEESRNNKSWYQRLNKSKSQQNFQTTQHLPSIPTSYFANPSQSSISTAHAQSFTSSSPNLVPPDSSSGTSINETYLTADPDPIYPSFSNHPAHASTFPNQRAHSSSLSAQSNRSTRSPSVPSFPSIPSPQRSGIVELSAQRSVRELEGYTPTPHDIAARAGARPQILHDHGVENLPVSELPFSPSDELRVRQIRRLSDPRYQDDMTSQAGSRQSVAIRTSVYEPASSSDEDDNEARHLPIPVSTEQGGPGQNHGPSPVSPLQSGEEWRRSAVSPNVTGIPSRPRADTARTGDVAFDPPEPTDEHIEHQAAQPTQRPGPTPLTQQTTDEEEQLRLALEASTSQSVPQVPAADDEEQMRLALAASMADFQSQAAEESRAEMEDAAVLEYVKKASLAEEAYLRNLRGESGQRGESSR